MARLRLFARRLSYNQSNNPIIQSNWKRCSRILHSDNDRLHWHCCCDPCRRRERKREGEKKEREKREKDAGGSQIIKINRFSCAQFSPRQLLKPAPSTVRSHRKPLDAFITDSSVFLGRI
ncbi:hypothetical protein JOB18_033490 [Solea senegalensis]|uniref:Uncharacterized protein n=1 Tax=Solea senegalensis TaxID=28829 RepID=A0AAV6RCM7_SOLSE|nr:hypothetical protein JOB18_033490 [Solea senegalensis]